MRNIIRRFPRFCIVGIVCTAISYTTFTIAAEHIHYLMAGFISWISGAGIGFALNRSFTFGIRGSEDFRRHFVLFLSGSVVQFMLASTGYWILIGIFNLAPIIAFPLNLAMTAAMMFLYLNFVTFKPRM